MLFIMVIYWFIALSEFKKQQRLTSQLKVLEQEVQQLRSKQTQYQNDIESYFLTWVHQIKTPITASKLLLERNED
ncbi:sensor histidine kinase, partial [Staphylococcus saprophyticus]